MPSRCSGERSIRSLRVFQQHEQLTGMSMKHPNGLAHYLAVRDGRRPPRYVQARSCAVTARGELWLRHAEALVRLYGDDASPVPPAPRAAPHGESSLLDL